MIVSRTTTVAPILRAIELGEVLERMDRDARRAGRTTPTDRERALADRAFRVTLASFPDAAYDERALEQDGPAVREILNRWFLRSRFWNRSFVKPHGYAGDFRMLEWMYDLEGDACADRTQPAIVNVLDGLYATVESVQAVWHRRRWFAELIRSEIAGRDRVRVLDVACGGSRYLRDLLRTSARHELEVTWVDQDPAALAFIDTWLGGVEATPHRLLCAPVRRLPGSLPAPACDAERYDVVISTGLFDYLPAGDARALLAHLGALTAPAGVVALCNFGPQDRSRVVKDWISDWRLTYRSEEELAALFPDDFRATVDRSPDGGLVYAVGRRPGRAGDPSAS